MKEIKKRKVKIKDIYLDRNNPRYGTYDKEEKNNMLNFMMSYSSKNILELLKDILNQEGTNPLANLGVIEEKDKWIVIDGNRRVACLKILLMSEQEVKEKLNNQILKFWNENEQKIINFQKSFKSENNSRVDVVVLKDRKEARIWVERLHTQIGGHTTQSWTTFERYLSQDDDVTKFVHKKMKSMGINRQTYVELVEHSIWKRIFTLGIFKKYFGIDKDDKSKIYVIEKEFNPKINAMINLLETKEIRYNKSFINNSQAAATIKLIDNEIKRSLELVNSKNQKNNFSKSLQKADDVIKEFNLNKNKLSSTKKNKNKLDKNDELLDKYVKNEKILNVIKQIRNLSFKNYKELICLSLRSLVEITVWEFSHKKMEKSSTWFSKNDLKNRILETIKEIEKSKYLPENKTTMKIIEKNIESFLLAANGNIHDVTFVSTERELKENWLRVKIFLVEVWRKLT